MGLLRDFFNQCRKPQGFLGKIMLSGMSIVHASVADWAMSLLDIPEPKEIVDIGCGNGRDIRELAKKYANSCVTGIDYSALSVQKSQKTNKALIAAGRCSIEECDVYNLQLPTNKFDLATAFETIYFWPELVHCFSQVRNILKPNGKFMIVLESDGQDKLTQWFQARIDGMNTYQIDELKQALKEAGFSSVQANQHHKRPWFMLLASK
ncbi:MAG: class I SAM-dependent methyltransferase [Neisseriaceae bacterium]|nr:class I SAM-dependent methyltransferase [Neisseriaceae bacterium]